MTIPRATPPATAEELRFAQAIEPMSGAPTRCKCPCHQGVGIMHVQPCCIPAQDLRTELERENFCARFRAWMLDRAGATFDDGSSIADYADDTGPTYWDDASMRDEGPEACAEADMSYWGE